MNTAYLVVTLVAIAAVASIAVADITGSSSSSPTRQTWGGAPVVAHQPGLLKAAGTRSGCRSVSSASLSSGRQRRSV